MVLVITTKIERGLEVAEAWEELGAPGVTLIESHGLHRLRERTKTLEINLIVSLASVMRQIEETNQIIFSVVEDDLVDPLIDAAGDVLGAVDPDWQGVGVANYGGWVNDKADALAAASTVEPDPKKREQLIKGALAEYRQQINIIPLHRQIIPDRKSVV